MDKLHVRPAPAKISPPIPPPPRSDDAFTALYRKHRRFVRSVLRGRGVAVANADDLTHEVFIVAFRHGVYPPCDKQTRSWLWVIAFHVASNHRTRKGYVMEHLVEEMPECAERPRMVERIDAARWIRRALDRLSPKLRPVFVAFDLEGRAMDEIARELGIKLKSAWSRLKLARDEIARWAGARVSLAA